MSKNNKDTKTFLLGSYQYQTFGTAAPKNKVLTDVGVIFPSKWSRLSQEELPCVLPYLHHDWVKNNHTNAQKDWREHLLGSRIHLNNI